MTDIHISGNALKANETTPVTAARPQPQGTNALSLPTTQEYLDRLESMIDHVRGNFNDLVREADPFLNTEHDSDPRALTEFPNGLSDINSRLLTLIEQLHRINDAIVLTTGRIPV